jgi:hypothetical protein
MALGAMTGYHRIFRHWHAHVTGRFFRGGRADSTAGGCLFKDVRRTVE